MEFEQIVSFLSGEYAYSVFFVCMVFCGLGMPLNVDLLMLFMGSLAGLGNLDPFKLYVMAISGLSIGENTTYLLGRLVGFRLLRVFPFYLIFKKSRIYKSSRFLKHKGPSVLFLVRFVPGTRAITFFTSGLFKMKYPKFFPMWFVGANMLCGSLISIGYFFIKGLEDARSSLPYIIIGMFVCATFLFLISKRILFKHVNKTN